MFAEDLSVFFSHAEHGTDAVLDGVPVQGIFDDAYIAVGELASTGPAYTLPSVAVMGLEEGASVLELVHPVTGANKRYAVLSVEPDGTGVSVLQLREA